MTLRSPKGSHTRPTASRTREAIWNSLAPILQNSNIVDLFCGSGAVGIEGLSRGAKSCLFVENHRPALVVLKENLAELEARAKRQNISVDICVSANDAKSAISMLQDSFYDIIWLDPPYEKVASFFSKNWLTLRTALNAEGVCVVESDKIGANAIWAYLESIEQAELLAKQKVYGKTVVSFIRKI